MKKKYVYLIIAVLILIYFGYKGFLLFYYKNWDTRTDGLSELLKDSGKIIEINKSSTIGQEKTSQFENIVYPTISEDFKLDEAKSGSDGSDKYETYFLYDDSSNVKAMFKIWVSDDNYPDMFISSDTAVYGFDFKKIDRQALLQKYDIQNNIDLLKYIINHYDDSVNILSSRDEIKMEYLIKTYTNMAIPTTKIDFITGHLNGFIYYHDPSKPGKYYEIHLTNNGKRYFIIFLNGKDENYFTIDNIKEFLSKVYFK